MLPAALILAGLACVSFALGRRVTDSGPPPGLPAAPQKDDHPLATVDVRPLLADRFGQLVNVQGTIEFVSEGKGDYPGLFLRVEEIDGTPVAAPFLLQLADDESGNDQKGAKDGMRGIFRGYETGQFRGILQNRSPVKEQAASPYFAHQFKITSVKENGNVSQR